MKNLDQIRAANALNVNIREGKGGGESVAKKVPAMIRENGILGAAAFAFDAGVGYEDVFNAVIAHLATVGCLPSAAPKSSPSPSSSQSLLSAFIAALGAADAATLRAVTAESLAYLNYLRRFAKKSNGEG